MVVPYERDVFEALVNDHLAAVVGAVRVVSPTERVFEFEVVDGIERGLHFGDGRGKVAARIARVGHFRRRLIVCAAASARAEVGSERGERAARLVLKLSDASTEDNDIAIRNGRD